MPLQLLQNVLSHIATQGEKQGHVHLIFQGFMHHQHVVAKESPRPCSDYISYG